MIKLIDKEYVRDDLLQLMVGTNDNEIIMDDKEIILLKVDDVIYIDKYLNHKRRSEFPYQDIPMHKDEETDTELYNILFEVNNDYLIYEMDEFSDNVIMNRFFKSDDGILWNYERAEDFDEDLFDVITYTRDELEELFNPKNYDGLFVIDTKGRMVVASTKVDGDILKGEILPTKDIEAKMQGQIVNIYGGLYPNMKMISVKDGVFEVSAFSLALDRDGTYVLTRHPVELPSVRIVDNIKGEEYERTGKVSI